MLPLAALALALVPAQVNDAASIPTAPKIAWTIRSAGQQAPEVTAAGLCVAGPDLRLVDPATGKLKSRVAAPNEKDPWVWVRSAPDGTWIAQAAEGQLTRFGAELTEPLWSLDSLASWFPVNLDAPGLVVGTNRSGLYARELETGKLRWKVDLKSPVSMTPATDGERIFIGTKAGTVSAYAVEDGQQLWSVETGAEFGWSSPTVAEGRLLLADRGRGGSIKSADIGKQVDQIEGPRGGALNAFDTATGKRLWGTIFGATGFSKPFVDPATNTVWAGFGHSVLPFDLTTGAKLDDQRIRTGANAFGSPRALGDRVIFGNLDGHLYVHARKGGALLWALEDPGQQVYSWTATGGRLFVQTQGRLVCITQDEADEGPAVAGTILRLEPETPPDN